MDNQTTSADRMVVNFASYFEPVRKSIRVRCTPERAFSVFTTDLARWWPLTTHSLSQARATGCGIDPLVGGQVYEVCDEERISWGWVLEWEPPQRFVLAWHPGGTREQAQEVEVRFTAVSDGTKVDLEHRQWEKLGERASAAREGYNAGWESVFVVLYARACAEQEHLS
jgi:uncharacterized protein YndB with AHSA1/START domain